MARSRRRRDEDDEDDDRDEAPPKRGPRNDAYVGMLGITFVGLAAAAGLLYTDLDLLQAQSIAPPPVSVPALSGAAPAPG